MIEVLNMFENPQILILSLWKKLISLEYENRKLFFFKNYGSVNNEYLLIGYLGNKMCTNPY